MGAGVLLSYCNRNLSYVAMRSVPTGSGIDSSGWRVGGL